MRTTLLSLLLAETASVAVTSASAERVSCGMAVSSLARTAEWRSASPRCCVAESAAAAPAATRVRVSHILVDTEDLALLVAERLDAGADFGRTAEAVSTCDSASRGGDLGWITPGMFVPEFDAVPLLSRPERHTHETQIERPGPGGSGRWRRRARFSAAAALARSRILCSMLL